MEDPLDYRTTDIGCAAYLHIMQVRLIKIEPGTKSWFVFEKKAREWTEKFWNDEAKVNPRVFQSTIRDLKARLHERGSNR